MKEIALIIFVICALGWIPILAIGKSIAWIVEAFHPEYIEEGENNEDNS